MDTASTTLELVARWGYISIFIIVAVENIEFFGSFPTSLIAAGMGALSAKEIFDPAWSLVVLILSSVVGDVIAYWLGRKLGRSLLLRWARHLVNGERLTKAEQIVGRWGGISIFFSRFIMASFQAIINIIAGITRMRFTTFVITATLGETVWAIFYFYLGFYSWPTVEGILSKIGSYGPVSVILVVTIIVVAHMVYRFRKKPSLKE